MVMAAEEVNSTIKIQTKLLVHDPLIKYSWHSGQYTTYAVSLTSNNTCFTYPISLVRRRFSEFVHLRKLLKSQHPSIEPPALPPKLIFNRFHPDAIDKRKFGLQTFLEKLLDEPLYLSNTCVHLFLQSNLTMFEIQNKVESNDNFPQLAFIPQRRRSNSCPSTLHSFTSSSCYSASAHSECGVNEDCLPNCSDATDLDSHKLVSLPVACRTVRKPLSIGSTLCSLPECDFLGHCDDSGSSLNSSPESDDQSLTPKRVTFNKCVLVAQVQDQNWQIAERPMKD